MPIHSLLAINPSFYYADLDAATRFYTETLGLELVADFGSARTVRTSPASFLTLVDTAHSLHKANEAKSVTLAFVTDKVEAWYDYLQRQGISIPYPLQASRSKAHESFVALDPEGYYLEFERFNHHPENYELSPRLRNIRPLRTDTPGFLPVSATVLWLYYKKLSQGSNFLTEQLGLALLVDQGFAQVYAAGGTGFVGPVDAGAGLHDYAPVKLVTVGLITDNLPGWRKHFQAIPQFGLQSLTADAMIGRRDFLLGSDPERYLWEFALYPEAQGNERLRELLLAK